MRSYRVICALCLVILIHIPGFAQDVLVFSKPVDPIVQISEKILKKAYQDIGIHIATKQLLSLL